MEVKREKWKGKIVFVVRDNGKIVTYSKTFKSLSSAKKKYKSHGTLQKGYTITPLKNYKEIIAPEKARIPRGTTKFQYSLETTYKGKKIFARSNQYKEGFTKEIMLNQAQKSLKGRIGGARYDATDIDHYNEEDKEMLKAFQNAKVRKVYYTEI